jgi:hypothetical protein
MSVAAPSLHHRGPLGLSPAALDLPVQAGTGRRDVDSGNVKSSAAHTVFSKSGAATSVGAMQ